MGLCAGTPEDPVWILWCAETSGRRGTVPAGDAGEGVRGQNGESV